MNKLFIFIFLIILAAFLQSSFIPINLVLILLICRSLVISQKENLILAFLGGILVGVLESQNLGFWTLTFLVLVKLLSLSKKLPVSKNILTILTVSSVAILLVSYLEQLVFKQTVDLKTVLIEIVVTVPFYFLVLFWEERFVVKPDNRLKLRR